MVSHLESISDWDTLDCRSGSFLIGFLMLNLSLEFHIVHALEVEVLNVDVLDVRRSVRCSNLPLMSTVFDSDFKARITAYFSAAHVYLNH